MKNTRYHLLDTIRGITIISMIIFHTLWNFVNIYGFDWDWYKGTYGYIWQQSICWCFILLSGFCFSLGRNPLKRGITVSLGGILVSIVTLIFMPQNRILFGILTLHGACMLIMIPLHKVFKRISATIGALLSFGVFLILRNVGDGYLGFETLKITKLPPVIYKNYLTAFLGFPPYSFYSADYFPLFPWLFLFITGYFLYRICEKYAVTKKLFAGGKIEPLSFIVRHSLIIYLIHQPIIFGLMYLILK